MAKELMSSCLFTDVQDSIPERLPTSLSYLPSQTENSDSEFSEYQDDESLITSDLDINNITDSFSDTDLEDSHIPRPWLSR